MAALQILLGYSSPIERHSLRFDGETDHDFRLRAEKSGKIARVLVAACLKNRCMQLYLENPELPQYTVESVLHSPTVRVEYEQAIAIGGVGECLAATAGKHWGKGPQVVPLEPDDWFYPDRITYLYKDNSLYKRRFEQRRRLKQLLGRNRSLVREAKSSTKEGFLGTLTTRQGRVIWKALGVEPGEFWRAVKGYVFLDLPPDLVQGEFDFRE